MNSAPSEPQANPALRASLWAGVLWASVLPEIVYRQFASGGLIWLPIVQAAVLVIVAGAVCRRDSRWRALCGFFMALAALRLGWSLIPMLAEQCASFQLWRAQQRWDLRWFIDRLLPVGGAILMLCTLIGSGLTRKDLFLRIGNLRALSKPEPVPLFYRSIPWTRIGVAALIFFGLGLPLVLFATLPLDFTRARWILPFLPLGLATAALNAANEEFQFRCVMLARLRPVVSDREATLLTAALFGLSHFFGQPSGLLGVLAAGMAGWIWAKSMIETRGFFWAFGIHMVQDVVIFAFLTMTVAPH